MASASTTRAFRCRLRITRSGVAISAGRERAGRDLVDERLEEHEVLAVDEGHLDGCAAQAAHRLQARRSRRRRRQLDVAIRASCRHRQLGRLLIAPRPPTKSRSRIRTNDTTAATKATHGATSRIVFRPSTSAERAVVATRPRSGAGVDAIACGAPPVEIAWASACACPASGLPLSAVDHRRAHL